MDRIRTGLGVVLGLFLHLSLLKNSDIAYFLQYNTPQSQHYPMGQKFPFHPHSIVTDNMQGIVLAGRQDTELSAEDTVHI